MTTNHTYSRIESETRAEAEKRYRDFVDSLNRITDRDIEENERRRKIRSSQPDTSKGTA